jgi:hypothetical protein
MIKNRFLGVIIIIVMLILCGFLCWENRENRLLKSEIRDLSVQLATSVQKVDTFLIRDSIPVYKERIVEVDRTDYKKLLADRELIKDLNLRIGQVEAENRMLRSTRDTVILTPVNDSVLRYKDKWADFSYYTYENRLDYQISDSITTFVTREYKHRFLWWKWGTKGYSVVNVSHNPHSKIEYNKYIRVR